MPQRTRGNRPVWQAVTGLVHDLTHINTIVVPHGGDATLAGRLRYVATRHGRTNVSIVAAASLTFTLCVLMAMLTYAVVTALRAPVSVVGLEAPFVTL